MGWYIAGGFVLGFFVAQMYLPGTAQPASAHLRIMTGMLFGFAILSPEVARFLRGRSWLEAVLAFLGPMMFVSGGATFGSVLADFLA